MIIKAILIYLIAMTLGLYTGNLFADYLVYSGNPAGSGLTTPAVEVAPPTFNAGDAMGVLGLTYSGS